MEKPNALFEGKYLRLMERKGWEYVERPAVTSVIAIIGIMDNQKIVLIEQHRVPFNASLIAPTVDCSSNQEGKHS